MTLPGQEPLDQFSPLDRKLTPHTGGPLRLAHTWVPASEARRIGAYLIRRALASNQGWRHMPGGPEANRAHREYGDPALYCARMVAALRGDTQTITVDGADDDPLDGPVLPDVPQATPPTGDTTVDAVHDQVHTARMAAWAVEADAAVADWTARLESSPSLRARQEAIREWADRVQLLLTLQEAEDDAVTLGDGIIALWPRPGGWPTVQVYDPGFYFPEIPANGDQVDFPDVVHVAWEFDETTAGRTERFVRRLTWQLVPITATRATEVDGVPVWVGPDGTPLREGEALTLPPTERVGADGIIRRTLPWHTDGEDTDVTCLFSDATWELSAVQAGEPFALDITEARTVTAHRYDMGIDFIPVIHRPNTPTGREHYGRALCDLAVRAFDDLAMVDTLTMKGAQFLGKPAVWASGVDVGTDAQVMPGMIHGLGATGVMHTLDLSAGLPQLMALGASIEGRIGVSLGIGELVGRARATGGAESGIRKLLELAPAISVVGNLRATRAPKDSLLLKMGQRMAQVTGVLDPGPTPMTRIRYGAFLPTDQVQVMEAVTAGLVAHAISTQTAVGMLIAAGYNIDDAQAEVQRIYSEDPEAARAVADATGSESAAAERLGVTLPDPPAAPPVIDLP